jgi:MraZ protein
MTERLSQDGQEGESQKLVHGGLLLGEWSRRLDERYRLSLPGAWADALSGKDGQCVFAKERRGCLSLWSPAAWGKWLEDGVELVGSKIRTGRLADRMDHVQKFGRLLSTRHRQVPMAGRGRITIPESFRDIFGVQPGESLFVVGAAICVELWHPDRWNEHVEQHMPEFRQLFDQLAD